MSQYPHEEILPDCPDPALEEFINDQLDDFVDDTPMDTDVILMHTAKFRVLAAKGAAVNAAREGRAPNGAPTGRILTGVDDT